MSDSGSDVDVVYQLRMVDISEVDPAGSISEQPITATAAADSVKAAERAFMDYLRRFRPATPQVICITTFKNGEALAERWRVYLPKVQQMIEYMLDERGQPVLE